MINSYTFGKISIDDKEYDFDVEVRWDGDVIKWWREQSHLFQITDIERALGFEPELVVMGTGKNGVAKIDDGLIQYLRENDIEHIGEKTSLAVKIFNKAIEDNKKVIGLFHLTC